MVAMEDESTAAAFTHTVRGSGGAFGVGVGGSGGGGLLDCAVLSHRAAQLEEDQQDSTGLFGQHGFVESRKITSHAAAFSCSEKLKFRIHGFRRKNEPNCRGFSESSCLMFR
jgi:hypothetical protein